MPVRAVYQVSAIRRFLYTCLFAVLLLGIQFGADIFFHLLERDHHMPVEKNVYDTEQQDGRRHGQGRAHNLKVKGEKGK